MTNQEIKLDFDRPNRTGLAEAVLCSSKSFEQLLAICQELKVTEQPMLFTRLELEIFQQLEEKMQGFLDYDSVSKTAFCRVSSLNNKSGEIAIVTGGTSDVPVAREALRTLQYYGLMALEINDVGVAGLWRLNERLDELKDKKIVICIAGMDAALPTVLGGLIPGLIIAVPSSVGYGVARGGETALNSLLCSCAPGLVVVNIDNGYGGACAAIRSLGHHSTKIDSTK